MSWLDPKARVIGEAVEVQEDGDLLSVGTVELRLRLPGKEEGGLLAFATIAWPDPPGEVAGEQLVEALDKIRQSVEYRLRVVGAEGLIRSWRENTR